MALCRFCRAPLTTKFVDLGASPLANSFLSEKQLTEVEPTYPLVAYLCKQCLLVQLPAVVSSEAIFNDYAYFSSYSESWLEHARKYTEMASSRFGLSTKSLVVEIASNDGYLLQFFVARGIPVVGIEPAANVAAVAVERGVETVVQFFGSQLARELRAARRGADLMIANNVLAHVPDLNDFVDGLRILLAADGVITIEVPHLLELMAGCQFDTIYHEHFSYFSLLTLSRVFEAHDLRIVDVERLPTHGGSLRVFVVHASQRQQSDAVRSILDLELSAGLDSAARYEGFTTQVRKTKWALLEFLINAKRDGKTIACYGAPAKGNTLLNYCGIGTDFIDFTVDRSPHKQGHYLPGSRIPIRSPEFIDSERPDYLLILPWNLKNEIISQTTRIRSWGGKWLVAIPHLEVLD